MLIFLFFGIIIFTNALSQEKSKASSISQEYKYADEKILISLTTKVKEICEKDSMTVTIFVRNNSKKSIFVFKKPFIGYAHEPIDPKVIQELGRLKELVDAYGQLNRSVVLDYGGIFTANLEVPYVMQEIQPNSSYITEGEIYGSKLKEVNYKQNFRISISFGYADLDSLKKYQRLFKREPQKVASGQIEISSLVVDAALIRKDLGCIEVTIKKCEQ